MSDLVVEIEQGKLRGQVSKSINGNQYYTYKGIPYAKPPVGELRFSVPQPPESWEGIRDATKDCNICPQLDKETSSILGDEDCLYLNVYTPKSPKTASTSVPVMLFLHGGGFVFGHGTNDQAHGPDYLIEKDVVIVSINYRLGILGFLCLDLKDAPGNMGLRDQVQALKWVQKNIDKFGGDPQNVTIFGISAGGASVEYLLLSPMAKGLFHKAIAQSGSSLLHWAQNRDVKSLAATIPVLQEKKKITDSVGLLQYLKQMPLKTLITASTLALSNDKWRGGIHFGFVPTIEQPGDWEPFLDKSTYKLMAQGQFNKVPFMTGFCSREGLLMISHGKPILDKLLNEKKFVDQFPFGFDTVEESEVETRLKKIYLQRENDFKDEDAFAIDFFTDVDFLGGCYVAASLIAKHNAPVYFYEFAYDGNLNYIKKCYNINRPGASHGDDGGYLVRSDKLKDPLNETDIFIRNAMNDMWTNFAKYGDPTLNTEGLPKWEPIAETGMPCYVIDKKPVMKYEIYPERMKLYTEMYKKNYGSD